MWPIFGFKSSFLHNDILIRNIIYIILYYILYFIYLFKNKKAGGYHFHQYFGLNNNINNYNDNDNEFQNVHNLLQKRKKTNNTNINNNNNNSNNSNNNSNNNLNNIIINKSEWKKKKNVLFWRGSDNGTRPSKPKYLSANSCKNLYIFIFIYFFIIYYLILII